MASKFEYLALEALRHFKEGQLAAWIGNEELAEQEFGKCIRAAFHAHEQSQSVELAHLIEIARSAPRKKDVVEVEVREKYLITDSRNIVPLLYSVLPIGIARLEFKCRIRWPPKKLRSLARRSDKLDATSVVDNNSWRWIEANQEKGFTGTFLLTFAEGIIYGQISTHEFITLDNIDSLTENIADSIRDKIIKLMNLAK